MKRYAAIYGSSSAGRHLYFEAKKIEELNIVAFIDNKSDETSIDGLEVFSSQSFWEAHKVDEIYITAGAQKTLRFMIEDCRKNAPETRLFILYDIAGKNKLALVDNGKWNNRWVRELKFSDEKPSLHYFEVPITDNCNLNCRGCLFASNLCVQDKNSQDVPFDRIEKDCMKMAELFYDVPWIRILGGEPLLHPNIINILKIYRKTFPTSEIDLCTNGLLIPKMSESFWNAIKQYDISVHVSGYKPVYNMLEKIDKVLKDNHVDYTILRRDTFLKYYTDEPTHDSAHNYTECIASGCYEVYRGKIFTCSAVIAFQRFNDTLGKKYKLKQGEDYFILDEAENGRLIKEKLEAPSFVCKYCDVDNSESFEWGYSKGSLKVEDFYVKKRTK